MVISSGTAANPEKISLKPGSSAPAAPLLSTNRPALKDLVTYVVPRVASEWYNVGLQLDLEPYVLNEIENTDHQPRRMFDKWLQGSSCSWQSVLNAVEKACGRKPMEDIRADVLESITSAQSTEGELTESVKGGRTLRMRPSASKEVEVAVCPKRRHSAPVHSAQEHAQKWPLLPSFTFPLETMPRAAQVVSSIMHNNKVYITPLAEEDCDESDVSRQVLVYSLTETERRWSMLPRVPSYNAGATIINGRITLVGGRNAGTNEITNVLSTWNEVNRQWEESDLTPMPTKRLSSGVCHHDNFLLVAGGVVDDEIVKFDNTVDVYNVSSKHWSTPEALNLPVPKLRSSHVVVFEEYVYLIGGATTWPAPPEEGESQYNPHAWRALWSDVKSVAEAADKQGAQTHTAVVLQEPSKKVKSVWRTIAAPPVVRPTVVSCKDSLLLVGGAKDGKPQSSIYEFIDGKNIEGKVGSWRLMGNMSVGRYRHAVVPVGSRGTALFVAGGCVQSKPRGKEKHVESSYTELVTLL